jgi:aspartyl/asparaginyl beta-hydroxylase (cupin superfamily)
MNSPADPRLQQAFAAIAAARARGDTAETGRLVDAALRLAPGHPQLLNARGMRALQAGDAAAARRDFLQAVAADSREPALWMNVAAAERALGNDAGEADALAGALDIDRLHFMAQLRLAELNERRGRMTAAASGWNAVVQLAQGMDESSPGLREIAARGQAFLARHNAAVLRGFDDALSAELRDLPAAARRRFDACIDHALGRRQIYANQCHGLHFPFLPADEFFDRAHFPWIVEIEAETQAIRAELEAVLAQDAAAIRPYVAMEPGTPVNKWSPLDGSLAWGAMHLWKDGKRDDAVCARVPHTAAVVERLPLSDLPGRTPTVFFSLLKPGTHLPAHTGVSNVRTIVHLPLIVPEGCDFRVGGETRPWREGEAWAFDDTIDHEAWNRSDQTRAILIFDVWNPHINEQERDLLRAFYATTDPSDSASRSAIQVSD